MQHGLLHSALEVMTTVAYSAPAGLVASIIVKRTQRFKYLIVFGWVLLTAGVASNVSASSTRNDAELVRLGC
jgi:uncharacterized membrane protein YwaF